MSSRLPASKHDRRRFLRVLSGAAAAFMGPPACMSPQQDADGHGPSGQGGAPDASPADGSTGGAAESEAGAEAEAGQDAPEPCAEPAPNPPGCEPQPSGRAVGRPCDFSGFRLQAAPHDDVFQSALIGRDVDGWYARSAVCTHMGCNLAVPDAIVPPGVVCPCHGSNFDQYGHVLSGPAGSDLRPMALTLSCDGILYVDVDVTVGPEVRLAY